MGFNLRRLSTFKGMCCKQGSEKPGFFKKTRPTVFWVLLGFAFFIFLFEWAVEKLVGWFSSSAKLLFRFTSTLDYLKICKFITYWSLETVNIKKSLIITLAWQSEIGLSLVQVFAGFFQGVLWVLPGCLNPGCKAVDFVYRACQMTCSVLGCLGSGVLDRLGGGIHL